MNLSRGFYYPTLDGLRFFAFLIVFLHHSLLGISSNNPLVNYFLVIIQKNGWVGVDLFFVLSGFLITSLLLQERKKFGKFSLKNFWIRRALRIWPLYYLAIIFGFFIAPHPSDPIYLKEISSNLPLYLIFLGNWAIVKDGYSLFADISHLWTISLEEQFYFIWPLVLLLVKNIKGAFVVGTLVVAASIVVRIVLSGIGVTHPGIYTNTFARIDTLTLGAILALVVYFKPNFLNKFKNLISLPFQFFVLILFSLFLYRIYLFDPARVLNVTFGYLIIGFFMLYFVYSALQKHGGLNGILAYKPFVLLGKISYGLYVWHILAIGLSFQALKNFNIVFKVVLALLITVSIGVISYYFYEALFLRLKSRFEKIRSRPV